MSRRQLPHSKHTEPSIADRVKMALATFASSLPPPAEQPPLDPVQKRMAELERELEALKRNPKSLEANQAIDALSAHPQGSLVLVTMMLWHEQHKEEIKSLAPNLYATLMSTEFQNLSPATLRSVALHIEAMASLVESKIPVH